MTEDKKKILETTLKEIREENKAERKRSTTLFITAVIPSIYSGFTSDGLPQTPQDWFGFFSRGSILALILYLLYRMWMEAKCRHKWYKVKGEQREILMQEYNNLSHENIEKFMHDFVNKTRDVEAVQIHKYKMIPEGKDIIIIIEFKTQYLKKDQRHYLNAITNYYKVDAEILQKFYEVKDHYDSDSVPRTKVLREIEDLMNDISNKITEEHVKIYDILISMAANINKYIGDDYILNNTPPQQHSAVTAIEDIVVEESQEDSTATAPQEEITVTAPENIIPKTPGKKRTGILGGVIYETGYSYDYEKENEEKENRKYYSVCGDDDIIITFILCTSFSYGDKLTTLIDDIMDSYNSMKEDYKVGDSNE